MGKKKKEKKKKEKIIYVDDNSTVVDMNVEGHPWYNKNPKPKKESSAKEKWSTFFNTMKTMVMPMLMTLGVMGILYLLILLFASI